MLERRTVECIFADDFAFPRSGNNIMKMDLCIDKTVV